MSGRSSSGSSIGGVIGMIVLGILSITGFLLLLVWPLFILYGYLKREIENDEFIDIEPVPQSFWLTADEKSHFRKTLDEQSNAKKVLAREMSVFNSIPEARVNKDGSYDKRSQSGRDNEAQLSRVGIAEGNVSHYECELSRLSKTPLERFNSWREKIVQYKTYKFTVFFLLLCIPIYELIVLTSLGYSDSNTLNAYVFYALTAPLQVIDGFFSLQGYLPFLFVQKYTGFDFVWKNWAIVMVVPPFLPIIPYLVYSSWCENRILSRMEILPEVTIDNLDAYYVFCEAPESVASVSTESALTGRPSTQECSTTTTENEEIDLAKRFESTIKRVEGKIETLSQSEEGTAPKSSSQLKKPHVLWRILATISALFSVALIVGGTGLILETIVGQENMSTISILLGLGAVASFLAAPYWNFKKAKKHSHLWNWQVVSVLAIVSLVAAIT